MILMGSNPDQEDGDPNPPAPPNPRSRPTAGQLFSLRAQDATGPDASQPSSGLSVHFSPSSSCFIRVFTEESLRPSVRPSARPQPPAENQQWQQGHDKDTGVRLSVPGFGQRNPSVWVLGGLLPGQGCSRCPLDPQSQGCCCNLAAPPPTKAPTNHSLQGV